MQCPPLPPAGAAHPSVRRMRGSQYSMAISTTFVEEVLPNHFGLSPRELTVEAKGAMAETAKRYSKVGRSWFTDRQPTTDAPRRTRNPLSLADPPPAPEI